MFTKKPHHSKYYLHMFIHKSFFENSQEQVRNAKILRKELSPGVFNMHKGRYKPIELPVKAIDRYTLFQKLQPGNVSQGFKKPASLVVQMGFYFTFLIYLFLFVCWFGLFSSDNLFLMVMGFLVRFFFNYRKN